MNCQIQEKVSTKKGNSSALVLSLSLVVAFWPVWIWYFQRLCDLSDEPLGIVALSTFAVLRFRQRGKTQEITLSPTVAALCAYCLAFLIAPKMLSAALALITVGFLLYHIQRRPLNTGHWTLLLLSLPLVASLNFYLGYPLRIAVAQGAVALLSINGFPVMADGTSLLWHNQLIEIDAPCSGIKMLWAALYMAAVLVSLKNLGRVKATAFLILGAGAAVFANVLRVASLFYLEAGIITAPQELPTSLAPMFENAVHTGTGITAFLLVALILLFADKRLATEMKDEPPVISNSDFLETASINGSSRKLFFAACLAAAILPGFSTVKAADNQAVQWPTEYLGHRLTVIPLTANESEFAKNFPGKIAMFKSDGQTIILRRVFQATRQLHPAADCYRASGFNINNLPRQIDSGGNSWNVLVASKNGRQLEVRERIYDLSGENYTDVSHWYWAAFWGQTKGPWWSITTITPLSPSKSI